ncbi:MAG: hypothetical protein AAFY29_13960 [Pseudomonadota bacterium]
MKLRIPLGTLATVLLLGCSGTTLREEPLPAPAQGVLAHDRDERITVTLESLIVRNGPGAWAVDADWDEYILRVENRSQARIEIVSATVVDSRRYVHETVGKRKALVKGSRRTASAYRDDGVDVHAGFSGGSLMAIGGVSGTAGAVAGVSVLYGSSAAALASAGAVLAAPVLVTAGVVRSVHNSSVGAEISRRQTSLPRHVAPGSSAVLDLFFPIAPSPGVLRVDYRDAAARHVLAIDVAKVLHGLHLTKDSGTTVSDSGAATAERF